ncbi:lytic transglycosylase domain-containing protein [Roseomonas xinghualingensis]|uniref:lytic transglycosylase domain-containing protein n=1 Tax=Roseomonas xinghualingensis TaxID=2986475 RepID=UPI0021F16391|nr:transglycosylase SLT domain-containing protein [Roseomonas sp. SXEYE001]MCV4209395.1 transglycosylase SLT domain-containing protein [Roseomonas sp. SXEYE001]
MQDFSSRRAHFLGTIRAEAQQKGIPPALADAVATVESAYDPSARGQDGEVGLMQILPSTAAMLGFRGSNAALAEPQTNIRYAVAYLARAWELADGNLCRALMKYRAGHGEERMTSLSVTYCRRAISHLASIGSPLATGPGAVVPPAMAGNTRRARGLDRVGLTGSERARLRKGQRTEADIRHYEAAQAARVRALTTRRPVGIRPGSIRRPAASRNASPGET